MSRLRYDYFPPASRFVLRMSRLLHDQLAGSFVDDLGWQLRSIASRAGLAAAFAQQIRNTLSATIEFITSHDAKHSPEYASEMRAHMVHAREVHACEMHAHEMHACEMHAHETHL
jgi:hypothetical protein